MVCACLLVTLPGAADVVGDAAETAPVQISEITVVPASTRTDATVVKVTATTQLTEQDVSSTVLLAPHPRLVLRIKGVAQPYRHNIIAVNDRHLLQIRTGFHPEFTRPELHLVFDLTSPDLEAPDIRQEGQTVTVRLATRHPEPTPPRPISRRVAPSPTLIPRATTPTPVPTPAPSAPPPATSTPPPSVSPTPRPRLVTQIHFYAATQYQPVAGEHSREAARYITEIVTSHRWDGSLLLRVTADAPLSPGSISQTRLPGPPPQQLLIVDGVTIPDPPQLLFEVEDANLSAIEIVPRSSTEPDQARLLLFLGSEQTVVSQIASRGRHLVLLLQPQDSSRQVDPATTTQPAASAAPSATVLTNITWWRRDDHSTMLLLLADGSLPVSALTYHQRQTPQGPAVVLVIPGIVRSELGELSLPATSLIRNVRCEVTASSGKPESSVTIIGTPPSITLARVVPLDAGMLVQLSR